MTQARVSPSRHAAVRKVKVLRSQSEEDVFAEIAAVSMAIVKAMDCLGSPASEKAPYLSRILEEGLNDLDKSDYHDIPDERRAAFRNNVKARYADLITAIRAQ